MTMAKKSAGQYFVWIILCLVLVGLLGFGASGFGGNIRSLGSVGEKDIPIRAYQEAMNKQIRDFSAQTGTNMTFQQAQAFGLDQVVLSQLITTRALDNEAANLQISIGDETVRDEVTNMATFAGADGKFDREAYKFSLERNGMSESEFETTIREDISRSMLQGAVISGVGTPDAYADTMVQYAGEKRDITWAALDASALTAPLPGPTDADLQTYYEANPADFTLPEVRNITYVWLTPAMIHDQVAIDPEAIRELYDDRIADFVKPERRLVERLVYIDQASAEAAKTRIDDGDVDFDTLVTERGLELSDADMGDVTESDLGAAGAAVFAANAGDVVGPFNTTLGPALFRMNAVLAAEQTTFEDAQDDLRAELAAARARRIIAEGIDGINDLIAGGAALEDLAERTDMEIGTIAWSENVQDDIAAYDNFRTAAAAVAEGDFPEINDLADGGIFALRLDSITPPTVQPLDDVRDAVAAGWNAQTTQSAVMALAAETALKVQPLTNFETLGLTATDDDGLTRRSFVGGTPPGFMEQVFTTNVGDITVVDNAGNGAIILRVDAITEPDPADPQTAADRTAASDAAAQGIAQDLFSAYASALQAETDIKIDTAAINAVNAQLQ